MSPCQHEQSDDVDHYQHRLNDAMDVVAMWRDALHEVAEVIEGVCVFHGDTSVLGVCVHVSALIDGLAEAVHASQGMLSLEYAGLK